MSIISRFFSRRNALRQVAKLKRDLRATIHGSDHYEDIPEPGALNPRNFCDQRWVGKDPDREDIEKQEAARQQLQQLRDSSEWDSVRSAACEALLSEEMRGCKKVELKTREDEEDWDTVGGYRIFKQDKDRDPQDPRDATSDRHYWR